MKIKHVFIQAFRQFGKVPVNLTSTLDSNKASNFVAIYAPNGFGKTSFFDAMEFCVTKSIQRVSVNFKENFKVDQEQGSTTFIHNKDLPELPIDIIMNFEGHDDIRTTCNPQDECSMLKGNGDNLYFRNAVLSQDWFSEFLSTSSAEQRFKIFTDYFVETKDLLDYYRRLSTASTSFNRMVIKTNKEVKSLKREIDGNLDAGVILQIEDGVKKLADNGISVRWEGKLEAEALTVLRMESENLISEIKAQKEDIANKIANLNLVSVGNDQIISIQEIENYEKAIDEKKKQLTGCQNWLQRLNVYLKMECQVEEGRKSLHLWQQEKDRLVYLTDNYELFNKVYQGVVQLSRVKELLLKKIANNHILLDDKYKRKKQQDGILSDYRKERNSIQNKISKLHDRYVELASLLKLKGETENLLALKENPLQEALKQHDALVNQKRFLYRLRISIEEGTIDCTIGIYADEVKFLKELNEKIHSEEEQLLLIEKRINEKGTLENELQQLIISSHKVLEHLKGSKCPLCGTDFETQEKLLKNISENTVISTALEEDLQEKNVLADKINKHKKTMSEKRKELFDKIDKENSEIIEKIKAVDISTKQLREEKEQLKSTWNNIISKLTQKYGDIKETVEEDKQKELKGLVEASETNITATLQILNSLEKEINQCHAEITSHEDKIKEIDEKSIALSEDDFYVEYTSRLGDEKFSEECLDSWKNRLASIDEESVQIGQLQKASQYKLDELIKSGFKKEDAPSMKNKRNVLAEELSEKLNVWNSTLSFLMNVCMIPIEGRAKSNEIKVAYESVLEATRKNQEKVDTKLTLLNKYEVLLALGEKYSTNEVRKAELRNKEEQLNEETQKRNLINDERVRLQKYLEDFVKGFFQLDIINKLYNTIDPHPEYKHIDFKCDFKNKDPRLNVVMYSVKDGHDTIVPNLYFSTAQINILSFCIFLAKALYAKTDKNEDLGCIFIDDPIQALDDINVLSMIDLLRNVAYSLDKQIILTTHDRNFFELLKKKVPAELFGSRFLELKQRGVFSEG
mgnify:FL=1